MEEKNTLEYLKQAIDEAIYTYGHCLIRDIDEAGMAEALNTWLEQSVDISNRLDAILYNRKETDAQ